MEAIMDVTRVIGSFSVDDIDAARRFYGEKLGLRLSAAAESALWLHGPSGHDTLVYHKPNHEAASFTVLNVVVDDIYRAIGELEALGVAFERYEGYGADAKGVVRSEGRAVAWFEDPAGNVLSVVQFG
jgi:catechol 2,3-dioxygenase-like lactoylglutathione lyase family enzyme